MTQTDNRRLSGTAAVLRSNDGMEARVRAKLIVDCTGYETRLVLKDDRANSFGPAVHSGGKFSSFFLFFPKQCTLIISLLLL